MRRIDSNDQYHGSAQYYNLVGKPPKFGCYQKHLRVLGLATTTFCVVLPESAGSRATLRANQRTELHILAQGILRRFY